MWIWPIPALMDTFTRKWEDGEIYKSKSLLGTNLQRFMCGDSVCMQGRVTVVPVNCFASWWRG